MRRTVCLRYGLPPGMRNASPEQIDHFVLLCAQLRARQVVQYAVAPGQTVIGVNGRLIDEGAEVRLEDLGWLQSPDGYGVSPQQQLRDLIATSRVLEKE